MREGKEEIFCSQVKWLGMRVELTRCYTHVQMHIHVQMHLHVCNLQTAKDETKPYKSLKT